MLKLSSEYQYILLLIINLFTSLIDNSVKCEWVELPQFSNDFKIYRFPDAKHNTELMNDLWNTKTQILSNSTTSPYTKMNNKITMLQPLKIMNISSANNDYYQLNFTQKNIEEAIELTTVFTKLTDKNDNLMEKPLNNLFNNYGIIQNISTVTSVELLLDTSHSEFNTKQTPSGQSFINYFPLQLFKTVHNTFLKGYFDGFYKKYQYLSNVKRTIFNKIETMITGIVKSRQKRTTEEGDHHMGFPSLEGALLAISFLTFSVYLIQLVMMLLRNISNNSAATTGTVLVNRNKRHLDELNDVIKVCEHLDRFAYGY